jgi:hypothetical protein
MADEDKVQLRHPDPSKKMPRMANAAYALMHRTALAVVPKQEPGITLVAYVDEMASRLPKAKGWDASLSARWWAMAMKFDLEARGELRRVKGKPPQRLVRTQPQGGTQ